jgi:hypothetical protein
MGRGSVALVLLYEPATARSRPVPIARILDTDLMLLAAKCAIVQAEARAAELSQADDLLGEAERAEVQRLRSVLALLIPGLAITDEPVVVQ